MPADTRSYSAPSLHRLYFARLHVVPDPPPNTVVNTGEVNVQCRSAAATARGRAKLLAGVVRQLELLSPVTAAEQLFKGLRVGHVLGQGCFGTVWRCEWHGVEVALKVRCQ
jgi:hypothetical protein